MEEIQNKLLFSSFYSICLVELTYIIQQWIVLLFSRDFLHLMKLLFRAGHFCIVDDIDINALTPLLVNLQINLIFIWYPGIFNQSEIRLRKLNSQSKAGKWYAQLRRKLSLVWTQQGYPKVRIEQEIKIVTQNIIRKYLWGIKLSKDIWRNLTLATCVDDIKNA